jgi:protein-tyrosine phosphatase
VIDLHCHLLPGVDDGPASTEDALALARAAAAAGTTTLVVTPHIDHKWRVDPLEVPTRVESMRAILADAHIAVDVLSGGEVALARLTELRPAEVEAVRLGGGPYILLESPHRSAGAAEFHIWVHNLRRRGESVVLAHPERSPIFLKNPERLDALVADGVLLSITGSALLGRFGRTVQGFALRLLRDGLVHNVASDSHDARRRGPELLAGLHAAERDLPGVLGQADWLTREVPNAVIAGASLPPRPELPERPRGLRRLLGRT